MMRRSNVILLALVAKVKSPSNVLAKETKRDVEEDESAKFSTYVATSSEAPELLLPYVEPTPFVSAKRLQAFLASVSIGAAIFSVVYYLLSKSMSRNHEEEQRCLQRVVESNRLAMMDPRTLIPDFTAPSSFNELKEKMRLHERELERKQAQIDRQTIMLHKEIVFRMKVWWNSSLTHVQEAFDRLGVLFQKRKERVAEVHIRRMLEDEGYELVKLRSGKTHIW